MLVYEYQRLINGVQSLINGVQSLINGVQSLINGVQSLINGVQSLINGVQRFINKVQSLINKVQSLIRYRKFKGLRTCNLYVASVSGLNPPELLLLGRPQDRTPLRLKCLKCLNTSTSSVQVLNFELLIPLPPAQSPNPQKLCLFLL